MLVTVENRQSKLSLLVFFTKMSICRPSLQFVHFILPCLLILINSNAFTDCKSIREGTNCRSDKVIWTITIGKGISNQNKLEHFYVLLSVLKVLSNILSTISKSTVSIII